MSPRWTQTPEERFWSNVAKASESECWEWTGAKSHGYGRFKFATRQAPSHHVMWFLTTGEWPEGHLHHTCRLPSCVNPSHLQDLTVEEHQELHAAERREQAAQLRETQEWFLCGHDKSPENTLVEVRGSHKCRRCYRAYQAAYRQQFHKPCVDGCGRLAWHPPFGRTGRCAWCGQKRATEFRKGQVAA